MERELVICFSFLVGIMLVSAGVGHTAEEIFVSVNGQVMSLQLAISSGKFNVTSYGGGVVNDENIVFGHGDVYVNVNGVDKGLQSAIGDNSLCLFDGGVGSYSSVEVVGHSAEEISVSFGGDKNLQTAINEGLFAGKWNNSVGDVCKGRQFVRSRCGMNENKVGAKVCCTPSCSGKACGDDGCGGSCGSCTSDKSCSSLGKCIYSGEHSVSFSFGAYYNAGYYRMTASGGNECRTYTVSPPGGTRDTGWKSCPAKLSGGGGYYSTTSISGTTMTLALDAPRSTSNDKHRKTLDIVSGVNSYNWWDT